MCNVCNGAVQFVIDRDPSARFRFGALQSRAARLVLRERYTLPTVPDSIVLLDESGVFTRSDAVLRVARGLRFPWPLAYGLIVVPRPIRDWLYDIVARNRYAWFGKRDACTVPTPDLRARFLDE